MVVITERPADEAISILRRRIGLHLNPFFGGALEDESRAVIDRITKPASDEWVNGFLELSDRWAARAEDASTVGDSEEATAAWHHAYDYAHIARYPVADNDLSRRAHALGLCSK